MLSDEWRAQSFLFELKPNADYASIFIDCPYPKNDDGKDLDNNDPPPGVVEELLHVKESSIGVIKKLESSPTSGEGRKKFIARLSEIRLLPNTVCSLSWTDQQRLLMFKVRAEVDAELLELKSFQKIANDISLDNPLEEYVKMASLNSLSLKCAYCENPLLLSSPGKLELLALPSDDFLETSPGMDYFCRDSCCHCSEQSTRELDLADGLPHQQWIPTENKALIADSFIIVHVKSLKSNAVAISRSNGIVQCSKCLTSVGKLKRTNSKIVQFENAAIDLRLYENQKQFVIERFGCLERYFVFLLLSQCESQSTLKLLVRTYDKRPYLLIWLLESYTLMMHGQLNEDTDKEDEIGAKIEHANPFPALKMLYKVFDAETAKSDPRANGQDTSVGIVELPLQCCMQLMEILLSSSHELPPICRFMGQFYVGFLKFQSLRG